MSEGEVEDSKQSSETALESAEDSSDKPAVPSGNRSGAVLLKNKIEIYPDKALPAYNVGKNMAYNAVLKDKSSSMLVAIVCERQWVPRLEAAFKYMKISNPNLATLVDHGVVYWPSALEERYVFVYLNNWRAPLLREGAESALGWKPDVVMELVVKPFIHVLQDFRDRDFVHGAFRPTNMFGALGSGDKETALKTVVLGDCLSAPASFVQPCLYEPIERGMTDPIGRGVGTLSDDLYSFGVSLAVIMRGSDPLSGLSDPEIVKKKIELGSYAAVTGKDRFKGEILELLRGLLHDDSTQRWTIDEVLIWLDGRRLSPKQALIRKKGARPLSFLGKKFYLLSVLGMSLDESAPESKRLIDDGALVQWLKRSIDDEETIARVESAVESARGSGNDSAYQDRLVTYLSFALDPFAPLRFKGLKLMGDGLGTAMVEAIVQKKDVKPFADLILHDLMTAWLAAHENTNIDITGLFAKFELSRRYIRSQKIGEGIERCLYLLCPESPCLSEKFSSYFITEPGELLLAFEKICQDGGAPQVFIDRHIAAFLMEMNSKLIESCLFDFNSKIESKIILADLRCLADIQKRYNVGAVPGISKIFSKRLGLAYEQFHDSRVRDKLKKEIDKLSGEGHLGKMVNLLIDPTLLNADANGFKVAQREHVFLSEELAALDDRLKNKDEFGVDTGHKWVALISSFLAVIVVLGGALSLFSGRGLF